MPEIVAHGRQSANPTIAACSQCHQTNGKGRPENAPVAGMPYDYIVQQLTEFRKGNRKTSDPRKTNTGTMAGFARAMTDEEIKQAATWFSSTPFTPWVKVVESSTVPKARPAGGLFLKLEGAEAGEEPIGDRILEVPEDARCRRWPDARRAISRGSSTTCSMEIGRAPGPLSWRLSSAISIRRTCWRQPPILLR